MVTLGEITIAIIVVAILFRLGLELAPVVIDWFRDTRDAANGVERKDDDNNEAR